MDEENTVKQPSQLILSKNIASEYDKLFYENMRLKSKRLQLINGLKEITMDNSNFGTYNYIQKLIRIAVE